jgi:hypothetical protein
MVKITPNSEADMDPKLFFTAPQNRTQKQYEALRAFFTGDCPAEEAARRYGYTLSSFYSLARDFKKKLFEDQEGNFFFATPSKGRKQKDTTGAINNMIVSLRKKYLSILDIKAVLDVQGHNVSEKYVYNTLKDDGFGRLPRRDQSTRRKASSTVRLEAPKSMLLDFAPERFSSENSLGILCLLPYIQAFGVDQAIEESWYPETGAIPRLSSILAFIALKLSNVKRYSADDVWCMDRGLGFFAGLNVLPKSSWYSSYADRTTREMNCQLIHGLNRIWSEYGLLSDTANLDFTTIPYWGDDSHLENNWSGKRNKSLSGIQAALAQDPDSGIITYGDTTVRHEGESDVCLEFLDFYQHSGAENVRYLVFDSKFTTYENLSRLSKTVKFITIRRRGKTIVSQLNQRPASDWKTVRVPAADGKGRSLKVIDESITLRGYEGTIRQIAITGHGKIKPALIITNDFDLKCQDIIRKYARRWLVEKVISEQVDFFHLNRVSSSMVIKVDFDLTMTILTHNLLRLMALDLEGYSDNCGNSLYNKFLANSGTVQIDAEYITINLKKKRNLPAILTAMAPFEDERVRFLGNKKIRFAGETRS